MNSHSIIFDGVSIPRFFYGTAWKGERTQQLVELAIAQGFRAIDTANQRRHYHEAAVGQAIAATIGKGLVSRGDLFLQTKFTFQRGQDHRLPYDPRASIAIQVAQSFASSLEHLGLEAIDSFLLHGPTQREGLVADDWAAWRAMESIHGSGRVRMLGASNVTLAQLEELVGQAHVPPRFVQNRCYAVRGWDRDVREFCSANGLAYQGFSLLTANRELLAGSEMAAIAKRYGHTVAQVVFRFALEIGMLPLTGTTDPNHMREDLDVFSFALDSEEVERIDRLGES